MVTGRSIDALSLNFLDGVAAGRLQHFYEIMGYLVGFIGKIATFTALH